MVRKDRGGLDAKEMRRDKKARRTLRGGKPSSKERKHGHGRCSLCDLGPVNKAAAKTKGRNKSSRPTAVDDLDPCSLTGMVGCDDWLRDFDYDGYDHSDHYDGYDGHDGHDNFSAFADCFPELDVACAGAASSSPPVYDDPRGSSSCDEDDSEDAGAQDARVVLAVATENAEEDKDDGDGDGDGVIVFHLVQPAGADTDVCDHADVGDHAVSLEVFGRVVPPDPASDLDSSDTDELSWEIVSSASEEEGGDCDEEIITEDVERDAAAPERTGLWAWINV
eukprot:m.27383 g.27383  ORF g.27383 m.27383 type:complete len:279 (-) comp8529_c1_seq1:41-877(-)